MLVHLPLLLHTASFGFDQFNHFLQDQGWIIAGQPVQHQVDEQQLVLVDLLQHGSQFATADRAHFQVVSEDVVEE